VWQRPGDKLLHNQSRTIGLAYGELRQAKYLHLHRGGCPAEAPNGEWRLASRFVPCWEMLIEFIANEIKSISPNIFLTSDWKGDALTFISKVMAGKRWNVNTGDFDE
jgi:hypothetical protein